MKKTLLGLLVLFSLDAQAGIKFPPVQSCPVVSNQFLTAISIAGVCTQAQPAASNLSNGVTGSGAVVLAASPTLSGTPLSTTAAADTNTTQIATTAYVVGQGYAKLASPTLTGTPLAPTATVGTNTTQVATTAYVDSAARGAAFSAYAGTTTSLTSGVATKVGFDTEEFDTDSVFASSRYTAGYSQYTQVNSCVTLDGGGINGADTFISIFKNGTEYKRGTNIITTTSIASCVSALVPLVNTDYVEIFFTVAGSGKSATTGAAVTWFNGVVVRRQ